jgi:regulator of ribonuclease activity A
MIAESAVQHGWAGVIIYGCVRDVDALAKLDLGVQALAAMPLKSVRRGVGEFELPIAFGGVVIENGEYIYADNNGVIVSAEPLTMP